MTAERKAAPGLTETSGEPQLRTDGISRRTLCAGIGGAAAMLALGGLKYLASPAQLRPPGGQDENRLLSLCVRCQRCFEICPRDVIRPAHIEDGIIGMRTPTLDFTYGWCNRCAEENGGAPLCAQVCPTGALSPDEAADDTASVLGYAEITTDWCLAYRLIGCRYCYDACEYDAIVLDEIGRPVVLADLCNGCGACQHACVSLKEGSISVGATHRAVIVKPCEE